MMKTIQCIVVDDEPLARELLISYVSRLKGWEIKASCRNVADTYEALYQNEIDVIFLDINMPDKTGIDFLAALKNPPLVIFTTAYAEYAARAFDLNAVDYLVKPITEERFGNAIDKVEKMICNHSSVLLAQQVDHIFLKQDNRMVKVVLDEILYVEALKDFSKFFLKDRNMLVSAHLKLVEEMLPAAHFLRVHRSYIVAFNKITAVQGNIIEVGKQAIPIGSTYKEELMKRLGLN
jgi:two-component system, LytTR family, response regulator